ncbi:NUDIX hydrolase [Liquorilactobacillus nagelii]|uniref:NUDIX hydrolase n=1 Tax=Liquorilactobacillus nagelii TaxID=82688 RepID=UPI0039ED4414
MIRELVGNTPIILNVAAGVVMNQHNEVLLNLRTDSHNWSLPGGFLEYGETYRQACLREMKEDSGLDVEIVKLLKTFDKGTATYPNGDVAQTITELFLVKPIGGHLLTEKTDETLALQYFSLVNLPPLFNQQTIDILTWLRKSY